MKILKLGINWLFLKYILYFYNFIQQLYLKKVGIMNIFLSWPLVVEIHLLWFNESTQNIVLQCCDLIINISYQGLEFITAESHLINFLWIIKHWRKLMKLHEICHQSLQMGGVNILLDQVDNSVIDRMGAVSGGGNEDRSLIRSKWEEWRSSVVT